MEHKKNFIFLVAFLLFVLTVPAFAAAETSIYAECKIPEILVTVPATGEIFINPYALPVELYGETVTDQIICEPTVIENQSEVPLEIDVSINARIRRSNMNLLETSTKGTGSTEKDVFLFFQMKPADSPESVTWDNAYDPAKHLIVVYGDASKEKMLTLAADGEPGHYGAFRLSGDCIAEPEAPWNTRDYINLRIAFTFHALTYGTKVA